MSALLYRDISNIEAIAPASTQEAVARHIGEHRNRVELEDADTAAVVGAGDSRSPRPRRRLRQRTRPRESAVVPELVEMA